MYSQSNTNANLRTISIGLPEQNLPVSELSGTWNVAGWDPASGIQTPGYVAQTNTVTVDGSGAVTANASCVGLNACTQGTPPFASFAANSSGGFDLVQSAQNKGRAFMFKTLAGKAALVVVADDGQFVIASRQEALTLPASGTAAHFREFNLIGNGSASALTENTVTVTEVNSTTNSFTRIRASDNRVDSFTVNSPRNGLRHRVANGCTVTGTSSNCAEVVQMPLQGMGITVTMSVGLTNPATAFYNVSVTRPTPVN